MLAVSESGQNNTPAQANILQAVHPHLDALGDFLDREVESFEPEIQEIVRYCLRHPGKKLRPMLVFYSGWTTDRQPSPDLIQAAAVMELVHQATLVHDDILDEASLRHNTLTIAKEHGPHVAVLLGDALFAHALKLASDFPTVDICRAVSLATRRVCSGEIVQSLQHKTPGVNIREYYRVIELKTAELFRVSCQLGAKLSGYKADYIEAASIFGKHLGIAYQIFDDIADFFGTESSIGKTLGTDLASGKQTLPLLFLLQALPDNERIDLLTHISKQTVSMETLNQTMHDHQIFAQVEEAFQREIHQATKALAPFKHLPPTEHMLTISQLVCEQLSRLKKT